MPAMGALRTIAWEGRVGANIAKSWAVRVGDFEERVWANDVGLAGSVP
ncbi:hypothetical protein CLV68_6598 [Actinokineospora cianjurensis]|uniref:Uncharacterized protein n=1 Tax=Actinokineospora cianjurensis TaxID=585224 RepID=A0A421AUB2_9PSEU|nr:hypothetical protein CLV68_6598 [Actinokineospora cianjurensis]